MLVNNNSFRSVGALGLIMVVAGAAHAGSLAPQQGKSNPRTVDQGRRLLAARNARFVENKGQWNSEAKFLAKGNGVDVWYTERGMRFDQHFRKGGKFAGQAVEMSFVGGKASHPVGRNPLRSSMDVFHGGKSVSGIRSFGEVYTKNVIEGVDLRGYYDAKSPRYDLIVAPGTPASTIRMAFKGANGLSLKSGALDIGTKVGGFFNGKPLAYQMVDGARRPVNARWALKDSRTAGFEVGAYDKSKPLVIDPLVFGTYYGGDNGSDEIRAAIGDGDSVIIVGSSNSPDFPALYGPYNNSFNPNGQDAFIARLTNNGADQDYAALIGGSGADVAQYVKIDGDNNVWIAGSSENGGSVSDYPSTSKINGTGSTKSSFFLTKFVRVPNPALGVPPLTPINLTSGAFIQSLVIGLEVPGDPADPSTVDKYLTGFDVQPGSGGKAVGFAMTGITVADGVSTNVIPASNAVTAAARLTGHLFEGHRSGFILRLSGDSTANTFTLNQAASQYIEGTRDNETRGVALDLDGYAYLVGTVYAGDPLNIDTGVPGNESFFETTPLVLQGVNKFYVTGRVQKSTDTFIRKYSPSGDFRPQNGGTSATCFSGLLGGNGDDEAGGIATTPRLERIYTGSALALGPSGDIYVTGTIDTSNDFPATTGAFQSDLTLDTNVYVARIDNAGKQILAATGLRVNSREISGNAAQLYSPWLPQTITPSGIAVDSRGLVFIAGNCRANTIAFPATIGNPNQPTSSTLSSIYFPTDAAQKAAFIAALSVEDQTYESPTGAEYPTTEGFLTGLDASLSTLVAQTYIGGIDDDFCYTPSIDPKTNQVFVIGWTDGSRYYLVGNVPPPTTYTYYIGPNTARPATLPNGPTDNLLTSPRIKANSALLATEVVGDYGYGAFGTSGVTLPFYLSGTYPYGTYPGLAYGRDGFIIKLSAVGTTAPSRLGSLTFVPNPVPSGGTTTGTITLSDVAPAGGLKVFITSPSTVVTPSAGLTTFSTTVTVPAGKTTATFSVTALNVAVNTDAIFTARSTQTGDTVSGMLTVSPLTYTLTLSPTTIVGTGTAPVTGTIALVNPTATALIFKLVSSDPAVVSLPATVTIPAGGTSASFTFNPAALPSGSTGESVTITASVTTVPLNTLTPVPATLLVQSVQAVPVSSITASKTTIRGGSGQVVFTVTFKQALPASTTLTFSFGSNGTVFSGPKVITVPARTTTFRATFNVNRVSRSIDATVTATANGTSVSTKVTVTR